MTGSETATGVLGAASALAAALTEENDALRVLDIPRALALLPDKAARVRMLQSAGPALASVPAAQRDAAAALLRRLDDLASENRKLLDRALAVQSRLLATLARAAPPAPRAGYARPGGALGRERAGTAPPLSLRARA